MRIPAALTLTLLAGSLLGSVAQAATFAVDSAADGVDAAPGDGVCESLAGTCTLRAAVMEANALAGADLIDLSAMDDPDAPITLSLAGVDESFIPATSGDAACAAVIEADASVGDLDITEDVTIQGAGPARTVIRWEARALAVPAVGDRIFHVQADVGATIGRVRFADLAITNGSVGVAESLDPDDPYNCEVTGASGARQVWQFRRFGGGVAVGHGAGVVLFDEALHASGAREPQRVPAAGEEEGTVTAVEFERVAVIGNWSGSDGGGVDSTAPITVMDGVFSGNEAAGDGGALRLAADAAISDTLIGDSSTDVPYASGAVTAGLLAPNVADDGGGVFVAGSQRSLIERSALNLNEATRGGAIASRLLSRLDISSTTISGNTTSDVGAGITTSGTVRLRNVTVANNRSTLDATGGGAGLNAFDTGLFRFANTLFSGNVMQAAGDPEPREANCGCTGTAAQCVTGVMVSEGYNLNDQATDTCALRALANDQLDKDPLIGPLADNGGRTETHRLKSTKVGDAESSPAIDTGANALCPNNDQRGSLRPEDGDVDADFDCDVGAFELFVPRSDLNIANVRAPDRVMRGEPFDVTIVIRNDDDVTVPAVTYDATVTPTTGLTILAAATSVGTCSVVAGDLDCAIGDLAAGAEATVVLTLSADEQDSYALKSVVAADPSLVDPVTGNNTVTSRVVAIGTGEISLSVAVDDTSVRVGDRVTFDFRISNDGEDDVNNASLVLPVPAGMNFYSASYNPAYSCVWGVVLFLCQAGEIAAGEAATFRLIVEPQVTGDAVFAASIGADQPDPDKSDNAVETTLNVSAKAKSGGGGGCAYHPGAPADPTLPGLLVMAVLALVWRRRRGGRMLHRDAIEPRT